MSSNTTVSFPVPEAPPSSAQTPIAQKLNQLLQRSTLNPFERDFLLRVLSRRQPFIWPAELEAIAQLWQIHGGDHA